MNPIILVGGAALVLWYLYSQSQTATTSSSQTKTTGSGSNSANQTQAIPAETANSPEPAVSHYLSQYTGQVPTSGLAKMILDGVSPNITNSPQTVWTWNYYLSLLMAKLSPNFTLPTPEQVLPNTPNPETATVSFAVWWNGVRPFLPSGLSGLGDLVSGTSFSVPQNPIVSQMGGWRV